MRILKFSRSDFHHLLFNFAGNKKLSISWAIVRKQLGDRLGDRLGVNEWNSEKIGFSTRANNIKN